MSDDPISERDGPTLEEMAHELETWRASRKPDPDVCPHCGHIPQGKPTDSELVTLYGYVLGGMKYAVHVRGVSLTSVKGTMSHMYRRIGTDCVAQTAYLLGRGDLTGGVQ